MISFFKKKSLQISSRHTCNLLREIKMHFSFEDNNDQENNNRNYNNRERQGQYRENRRGTENGERKGFTSFNRQSDNNRHSRDSEDSYNPEQKRYRDNNTNYNNRNTDNQQNYNQYDNYQDKRYNRPNNTNRRDREGGFQRKQRSDNENQRNQGYNQFDSKSSFSEEIKLEAGFEFKRQLIQLEQIDKDQELMQNHLREQGKVIIKQNRSGIEDVGFMQDINIFGEEISNQWKQEEFISATAIQSQTWPVLLQGGNMIGISQTGSGKTLAYMLPIFKHVMSQVYWKKVQGPMAVVLAPTRELVNQIYKVSRQMSSQSGIRICQVYGGASRQRQEEDIKRRCDILIATPGRLIDFMQEGVVELNVTTMLVLDEADRMLDMGFEDQLRTVMKAVREDKQTLMFSATWPKEIQRFAQKFIDNYVHVQIGDEQLTVNKDITQFVDYVPERQKGKRLVDYLNQMALVNESKHKTLVFVGKKVRCDDLVKYLYSKQVNALQLHGDMSQAARDNALYKFRKGYVQVLVATDIAARGLDVKDIKYVINVDLPQQIDDYVHRIGRTGRAGQQGYAISFYGEKDLTFTHPLLSFMQRSYAQISPLLLSFSQIRKGREHVFRRRLSDEFTQNGQENFEHITNTINPKKEDDSEGQEVQEQQQQQVQQDQEEVQHQEEEEEEEREEDKEGQLQQ